MPKPLRALVVEDNEDDAEFLLISLRNSGYDVSSSALKPKPSCSRRSRSRSGI